jgi:hypothetical protein
VPELSTSELVRGMRNAKEFVLLLSSGGEHRYRIRCSIVARHRRFRNLQALMGLLSSHALAANNVPPRDQMQPR